MLFLSILSETKIFFKSISFIFGRKIFDILHDYDNKTFREIGFELCIHVNILKTIEKFDRGVNLHMLIK